MKTFSSPSSPLHPITVYLCLASLVLWGLAGKASGQGVVDGVQDYDYSGGQYNGLSSDVVLNGVLEAPSVAGAAVSEANSFVNNVASFGAWRSFHQVNGGAGVTGGLNLGLPNIFLNQSSVVAGQNKDNFLGLRLGPFYVDQIYAGAGALYSDSQGNVPGATIASQQDDHWAGVVWAGARLTTYITDRFALTIRPWVYWLPLEGEVGWAAGGGYFGLSGWISPQTAAQIAFQVPVGRWTFSLYDQFQAFFAQDSLLGEAFFIDARAWDMSPVDPAGRFQFGGFGPASVDLISDTDIESNGDLFQSDRMFYRNQIVASATTQIGETTSFSGFYSRYDHWDNNFRHLGAWDTLGATIMQNTSNFRPYAAYFASTQDGFDSLHQWLVVGASFQASSEIQGYAQAGYLWNSGAEDTYAQDTWLGRFGLLQRLGMYTTHAFEMGRSVTDPDFSARSISDYASYMINQTIGPRMTSSLYATYANREFLGRQNSEHSVAAVGAVLNYVISNKSSMSALVSFERLDIEAPRRGWDLWTYRMSYFRRIGQSVAAHMLYQYQNAGSGATQRDEFSEHLIYAGVIKQF